MPESSVLLAKVESGMIYDGQGTSSFGTSWKEDDQARSLPKCPLISCLGCVVLAGVIIVAYVDSSAIAQEESLHKEEAASARIRQRLDATLANEARKTKLLDQKLTQLSQVQRMQESTGKLLTKRQTGLNRIHNALNNELSALRAEEAAETKEEAAEQKTEKIVRKISAAQQKYSQTLQKEASVLSLEKKALEAKMATQKAKHTIRPPRKRPLTAEPEDKFTEDEMVLPTTGSTVRRRKLVRKCRASTSHKDAGYMDNYRGWYDVSGCGKCYDYCRWVGNTGPGGDPSLKASSGTSWWSCRPSGSSISYTKRGHFGNEVSSTFTYQRCLHKGAELPN